MSLVEFKNYSVKFYPWKLTIFFASKEKDNTVL